jgi:hypothetical protein
VGTRAFRTCHNELTGSMKARINMKKLPLDVEASVDGSSKIDLVFRVDGSLMTS